MDLGGGDKATLVTVSASTRLVLLSRCCPSGQTSTMLAVDVGPLKTHSYGEPSQRHDLLLIEASLPSLQFTRLTGCHAQLVSRSTGIRW